MECLRKSRPQHKLLPLDIRESLGHQNAEYQGRRKGYPGDRKFSPHSHEGGSDRSRNGRSTRKPFGVGAGHYHQGVAKERRLQSELQGGECRRKRRLGREIPGAPELSTHLPPNSTHLPPSPIHLPPSLRCPSFLFELHPSPHPLGLLFRTLSGCFFALSILLLLGWSVRTNRRMRIDISRGQWLCQLSEEGTEWRWPQLSIDEFKQSAQEAVEACRQVRVVLLWKKGFMTCSRAEWGRMISFKKVCESVQVV